MKKVTITILTVILMLSVLLSACTNNTTPAPTEEPTVATAEPTEEPVVEETPEPKKEIEMPTLPDIDFEGLDFFDDGYEVVEYKGSVDGDTATFLVGGLPINTRFLAIDTPETNSSTYGVQPWGMAAKAYTNEKLENAEQIILELDEESDIFDDYDRLLAWIWVDGELLNFTLVEEGLAYVKYLYGDYKYNNTMIQLESSIQKTGMKIWGEDDPDYDYDESVKAVDLAELRQVTKGANVTISGIVTSKIGKNVFIETEAGAVYIYTSKYNYSALYVGNEISLTGKVLEYNGLLEISDIMDKQIDLVSENNVIQPMELSITDVSEDYEARYMRLNGVTVEEIVTIEDQKGYDVVVSKDGHEAIVRIDKYLDPYIEPDFFSVGDTFDVIGNIGQYGSVYQIMISSEADIID